MELVTEEAEKRIQYALPEIFSLVIDDWTKNSTNFVGVFASYPAANSQGYNSTLLSFSPLFFETNFTAKDHYQFLEWLLNVYGKTMSDVIAIIGDNAEVNKALSNLCEKPLIRFASHRFSLAVSLFLSDHACRNNQQIFRYLDQTSHIKILCKATTENGSWASFKEMKHAGAARSPC